MGDIESHPGQSLTDTELPIGARCSVRVSWLRRSADVGQVGQGARLAGRSRYACPSSSERITARIWAVSLINIIP